MPYAIDQPPENLSLAEMTEVAIANLYDGKRGKGFFIMVEGGKIDWACHANDAMATIGDMLDFDNAIGVALEFYKKHPWETLIIVTGDHETGGMTIGQRSTAYMATTTVARSEKEFEKTSEAGEGRHKATYARRLRPQAARQSLRAIGIWSTCMKDFFGMRLCRAQRAYLKEKLEEAYDKSCAGVNDNCSEKKQLL
jgi:alkaline phosphatase